MGRFTLAAAYLAAATVIICVALLWGAREADRGYSEGRHQVCVELAAAGVDIGGASSIGPDGETERTGC